MNEKSIKFVVLGDIGVGKTSIVRQYTLNVFEPEYCISTEPLFEVKELNIDNTAVSVQIWDIPGNEIFGSKTHIYYRYSHAAVLVFDLTRPETLKRAVAWGQDFMEKMELASSGEDSSCPVILCGNKLDLTSPQNKMKGFDGEQYCKENNFTAYYEVSARENANIISTFRVLTEKVLKQEEEQKSSSK